MLAGPAPGTDEALRAYREIRRDIAEAEAQLAEEAPRRSPRTRRGDGSGRQRGSHLADARV